MYFSSAFLSLHVCVCVCVGVCVYVCACVCVCVWVCVYVCACVHYGVSLGLLAETNWVTQPGCCGTCTGLHCRTHCCCGQAVVPTREEGVGYLSLIPILYSQSRGSLGGYFHFHCVELWNTQLTNVL